MHYIIKIGHFGLRKITAGDLDYLIRLDSKPEVTEHMPHGQEGSERLQQKLDQLVAEEQQYGYGSMLVFDMNNGDFVGRVGYGEITETGETEVGYVLMPHYWGQGYATKMLRILLERAPEVIKKDKVIAYTKVGHEASERVMQKAGMTFERRDFFDGVACVVYSYPLNQNIAVQT